ncbi:hypothetical protein GHT06_013825 [Daphnia sinensis]|uniref:Nose resistant-to-fluoxetine protein N-terminal domain-containing protein n=1 Tax=Daphnia sinensis TaxID=1820382 RepID=A0AAD5LL62_9CRUS|nr:hypothetical protein GHT06_013825 [Daphnia sinensis]
MAKIIHCTSLAFLVLALLVDPSSSLADSQLFDLILTLKNPSCPSFLIIFDQLSWDEEIEELSEELLQFSQSNSIILLSSHQNVLQTCGKNDGKSTTCNNAVVFSRDPDELTRIYNQVMNCFYVSKMFIITQMTSDSADAWLKNMKKEIIILILRESNKGLRQIRNWMINNHVHHTKLVRNTIVTKEVLGFHEGKNLMGRNLRVATLNFPPVVFIANQSNTKNIYGIEPSLMEVLASDLNFTFDYFPVSPNEMWGSVSGEGENRTATGLLGALMKKEADVALGNLYIDYTRLSIIGFSSYYKISEECFSVPATRPYPKWTALYHPFSIEVWLATFFSIFFVILTLRLVAMWSIESSMVDAYYRDPAVCFMTVIGHLFGLQQTQEIRSMANRLFLVWWLFGALILSTGYRSGLISFMTFPFTPPPIDTIQQLVASPLKKIVYDPLMKEILTNSNNSLQRQLGRQMITNDNLTYMFSLMNSNDWAVDANLDNLRYVVATQYPMTRAGPQVHLMRECVFAMRAALGLQKESPLKPYFDREIQRLIEAGLIEYHRSRFAKKAVVWNPKASKQKIVAFSLDSLQGAFYSLALCVLASVLALIGEVIHALIKTRLCAGTVAGQPGGSPATVSSLNALTGCRMDYLIDKYLFLTILLAVMISCNGQTILGVQHFARQRLEQESWAEIARRAEDRLVTNVQLDDLHRELKTSLFVPNSKYNYSSQCIEDVLFYVDSLLVNRSQWALEMLESSAQLPAGVFGAGNYHAEGLFDECIAVRAGSNRFKGQYCTVFFKPEPVEQSRMMVPTMESNQTSTAFILLHQLFGTSVLDAVQVEPRISSADPSTYMLPSFGLCIPSSCSASDLAHSVAQLIGRYVIANQSIVTIADEKYCFTAEEDSSTSFSGPDIAVMATLGVIGFLVLLATAHESWRMYRGISFSGSDNPAVSVLHCFSALNNGRKVLSLKSAGSDNLSSLHGIRFFSTCWVVLGHTWLKGVMSNVINPKMVVEEAMRWEMETIINATVSVDSFFLMSGLLVSYLLLRELDRNEGKFNLLLFYVHRYLRLTPVYAIILGFIATLMVYIGTGPNWYNVVIASEGCRITWWRQFLYINNLFPTDMNVQCMGETWYIAVDMQLFVLAPLLIYPLWRWKKTGLILLAIVTLATLAANFAVYAIYSFPPTLMPSRMQEMMNLVMTYMDNYYSKPWTRAPPYLIGIWTGWYLHRVKQSKLHVSPWIVALLWTLSGAVAASIIYGLTPYVNEALVPTIDDVVKLTYGPLHRAAWALALAWTIVACIHGYGGFIDRFLSWSGFLPLSRLTYCVYLIHYDYLNVFYSLNRKMNYYSFIDQLTTFFGITVTVFGLALIVSVCVEAPFINLERWVFKSHAARGIKAKESRTDPEPYANNGHVNGTFNSEENSVNVEITSGMKM